MKLRYIFAVSALAGLALFFALHFLSPVYGRVETDQAIRSVTQTPIIDDFEGGFPANWFQYGDYGSGTAIATTLVVTNSVPGVITNTVMSIDYVSAGWGAGTGRNLGGEDWSQYAGLSFWFYGSDSGAMYRVILSDNPNPAVPGDSAERFAFEFNDAFTGWQFINIPWHAFFRDYAYQPPGAPNDGLTLTDTQAYAIALPSGTRVTYLDQVQLVQYAIVDDFESGFPANWFQYGDYGSGTTIATTLVSTDTVPGLPINTVLSIDYVSAGWGAGTGRDLGGPDWSAYDGFSFWFYGSNSGATYRVILSDNVNPAIPGDSAERFAYEFPDDFSGWRHVTIPWAEFFRDYAYQPPGAPNDGLTLTEMQAYAFALPLGQRMTDVDNVAIFGDGQVPLTISFAAADYNVAEGETAVLTATLNMTATYPVTVTYATADGLALDGEDYTAVSGTLVFPPNTTQQTLAVTTLDDTIYEGNEPFTVQLSDPVGAALHNPYVAEVTILDDEEAPAPNPSKMVVIDNFETGLPHGQDGNGLAIGFVVWGDFWNGTTVAITTTSTISAGLPAVPGKPDANQVINLESMVVGWGGFSHAFENGAVDTWVSQDWSGYTGIAFWYYGTGTGTTVFVDIAENRNPGSISDDAERWSYEWTDNTAGWQFVQIPFTDLHRKDIGNGAPNDGWAGEEVYGWALGTVGTGGNTENRYVDDFGLLVRVTAVDNFEAGLPHGQDGNGLAIGFVVWGDFWNGTTVAITTTSTVSASIPAVPGQPDTNQVINLESMVVGWGGFTHAFENGAVDTWVSQDWSSYEGVCFWYYGTGTGTTVFVDIAENRNPGSTSDDAERWSYEWTDDMAGWQFIQIPFTDLHRKDIGNGAPNDGWTGEQVYGWALGTVGTGGNMENRYVDDFSIYGNVGGEQELKVAFAAARYAVAEGETAVLTITLNMTATDPVMVHYASAEGYAIPHRDYTPVSGTLTIPAGALTQTFAIPTLDDTKYEGDENLMLVLSDPVSVALGFQFRAILNIVDDEIADPALVHDFEGYHSFMTTGAVDLSITELMTGSALALPGQGSYEQVLTVDYDTTGGPAQFTQTFAEGQDWSGYEGLSFWYYGSGAGGTVAIELLGNQIDTTATTPPDDWTLVWQDEFTGAAGTPPNPNIWRHEIGDGTLNGIPGWGNSESEYYSDSTDNAALDGSGNLAIKLQEVVTSTTDLACWYGPCEYTSARLISADRMEYKYGRIEARVQVPSGGNGLWPAFWMLGANIDEVGWPQSGEIDIMEYVSRIPTEVFGTVHGPGYSGGSSFGGTYDLGVPVSQTYHVFTIEWGPDEIHWYVDGINYHNAIPSDVAPNEWVYNHTFYMILNLAIGGNFGGSIDPNLTFPQQMLVDYVRVYQADNSSERFEASFVDNFSGWQQVTIPFADMVRSDDQPADAPDDGLTLTDVWGYGVKLPDETSGMFHMDRIYLETTIPMPVYMLYVPVAVRP